MRSKLYIFIGLKLVTSHETIRQEVLLHLHQVSDSTNDPETKLCLCRFSPFSELITILNASRSASAHRLRLVNEIRIDRRLEEYQFSHSQNYPIIELAHLF